MADETRDVFVMVGDGSYLMMATELVTAVQEGIKVIVVLVQNHGFASIGSLSEALGSQRFGTAYRYRSDDGRLDGAKLPVDLAANAASLGADVVKAVALGADAVLVGRPYVYGLAAGGQDGVEAVIRQLAAETDLTMALSGARSVADLDRSLVA